MHACMYLYVSVCVCMYLYVYVCVCMCMYVYVVYVWVCMCVYVCIHIHTHSNMNIHISIVGWIYIQFHVDQIDHDRTCRDARDNPRNGERWRSYWSLLVLYGDHVWLRNSSGGQILKGSYYASLSWRKLLKSSPCWTLAIPSAPTGEAQEKFSKHGGAQGRSRTFLGTVNPNIPW